MYASLSLNGSSSLSFLQTPIKHRLHIPKQHPPNITDIGTANKSHRPMLPNPLPNTPVNGMACKIIADVKDLPDFSHVVPSHL